MEQKTPLLSICIPTYNREKCLDDCLLSITKQFIEDPKLLETIEVVISDNDSKDNTKALVEKYQERFNNIRYSKNESNIGFDRNLLKVVESSTGEYCLTFGDDDGFFDKSLSLLLENIKHYNSPYFILNCWGYDHDLVHPVLQKPNRELSDDITYSTVSDYVHSIKGYTDLVGNFGGISMQMFKRSIWMNFNEKEKYLDTQAVHLFILLSAFKNEKVILLAEPTVKTRNDNMRWDICPGFETVSKRQESTMKIALWISDLYNLDLSEKKMRRYFLIQSYILSLKNWVKKTLFKLGLRKY
jgi:abequosyltransferase